MCDIRLRCNTSRVSEITSVSDIRIPINHNVSVETAVLKGGLVML